MRVPRLLTRPVRLVPALLGLLLAVSACGSLAEPAANVDGRDIESDTLRAELDAAAEFAAANPNQATGFEPDLQGNFTMDGARFLLGELISAEVIGRAVAADGLEVTDDDLAAAEALVAPFDSTPWLEEFIERQAQLNALGREAATAVGAPSTVEEWFELNGERFACVSHLLVETEDEALAARSRVVDDGEDFAAVAAEVSIDTGSAADGGSLGCADASRFVPEFAVAVVEQPVGEVGEPVRSDFGFHVVLVESRGDGVPLAEIEADVRNAFQPEFAALVEQVRTDLLVGADVSVDDRYGTWDDEVLAVVDG